MKLKTGNPRVRGPRRNPRHDQRAAQRIEPATFAWLEPLADVDPVVVEREIVVDRNVDRPVFVDRPVEVERIVEVEKPIYVDRTVEVEKLVEKVVEKEIVVEKPVYVDRTVEVEKIVEVEKPVEKIVEKSIIVEKEVFRDRPIVKETAEVLAGAAAVKKLSKKEKKAEKAPKAIIVGRGPSLATKVGRVMPKPLPVLAGVMSLLAVLVGLSLMSPSSENANAERGTASSKLSSSKSATPSLTLAKNQGRLRGSSRDPFAAKGYTAPDPTPATAAAAKANAAKANAAKAAAQTRAAAPASAPTSLYTAALTTYSSYTPWTKTRKRAGGWIDFGQKPTVKVLSVGKNSIELFVVTDVEVVKDKSTHISYNKPVRQVKLAKGGVVRFADYRDIQGDDVTYTIRYEGSDKIKIAPKQ
jgi:hypothetical protein